MEWQNPPGGSSGRKVILSGRFDNATRGIPPSGGRASLVVTTALGAKGWEASFDGQGAQEKVFNYDWTQHFGQVSTWTFYYKAASAFGVTDGIFRLWVNGIQILDWTDALAQQWGFLGFSFPTIFARPTVDQTEYFWDLVVWEP